MAQERLGNIGYMAMAKETGAKGTPVIPNIFFMLYKESLATNLNLIKDNPVAGHKFATHQTVLGQRSHQGDFTVLGEANTFNYLLDMTLTQGSVTGSNPYTRPFTLSTLQDPKSYTIDISTGNVVTRFWGVEASKIVLGWEKNEMRPNISVSALGSFQGRNISSVTGSGPYTVTLDTSVYGPNPTKGLVVGDLIRFYDVSAGTSIDATVATVPNATTFTTVTNPTAIASGDYVYLRPATPAFNNLAPFTWANTWFCFGPTATAALAAAQTRVEQGSGWSVMHNFEDDKGADRSGDLDPAALVRKQGDISLKVKRFFDTPEDLQNMTQLTKTACVIRHFAGATNQYELRVTYNHLKTDGKPKPQIESDSINYSELDYVVQYDDTDGQAFDVKNISAIAVV